MATVVVRNLPDETHRALKARAVEHGRSTEAEIRNILETTVRPSERVHLGTALGELGRRIGLTDDDLAAIEQERERSPVEPMSIG
ncbi:MAG: antitoxin [Candidatus Nanopelagicales bacterium]|nr:antitoxin [Candidatus Nanopelagicales bacterium]